MKCLYCRESMVIFKKYRTERCEPREVDWICPNCEAVCNDNEAYGLDWEEGEIKMEVELNEYGVYETTIHGQTYSFVADTEKEAELYALQIANDLRD